MALYIPLLNYTKMKELYLLKRDAVCMKPRFIKKRPGCWLGFYFMLLPLLAFNFHSSAGDLQSPRISGSGLDEYGVYIEFFLPVKNNDGTNHRVTTGSLWYGQNADGSGYDKQIASFSAFDNDDDNFQISYFIHSGYVRVKGRTEEFTGMQIPGGAGVVRDGTSGTNTTLILRLYLPQDKLAEVLGFHLHLYVTATGAAKDPGNKDYYFSTSTSIDFIPDPDFSFAPSATPGRMSVKYAYNAPDNVIGTAGDYTITHWMDNNESAKVTDNTNQNATGSLDVNMSSFESYRTFWTEATGKGGYLTYKDWSNVYVPAYVWPSSFTAEYDSMNNVTVKWRVNTKSLGTGYVENDNFEVQRSTDKTFGTNVTTVTSTQAYQATQADYQVIDDLSDIKGGDTIYYRIRRTKTKNDWNWEEAKTTAVVVEMNTTQQAGTAVLETVDGAPVGVITWTPFRGVWTQGTTFEIKKSNKTTGAVAATFSLTEEEARSGQYRDENITYCNEFTYSLVVKLGNGYDSPPEQQVSGRILAVKIGEIKNLSVSKGYFPDRVELHWSSEGVFDNYIVKRKVYGSADDYVQIASVPGSSTSFIRTDDSKGTPGVYYQYMVIGAVKCNNEIRYSKNALYGIGFRAPTGNIYGRVTYENGQAVQNVAVRLESQGDTKRGQSVYLNGNALSFLKIDRLQTRFSDSALTLETWIKPDNLNGSPENQVIFSRENQYELGFDAKGHIYFSYKNDSVAGSYRNAHNSFVHIAGIHTRDSLKIMLGDSVIGRKAIAYAPANNPAEQVFIGGRADGRNFKGYIDEMLVWNKALSDSAIAVDHTRLLTGGEPGLVAYWRFDETIADQFYDISHRGDQYNRNDGIMDANHVVHSDVIPTFSQLSLKAYTDSSGNYMITGVPYTGVNGTTYKIVPQLGTHQFDPVAVNRLVSASASSFTVDFTDKSSFPVSGYVLYNNSTVPVKGVRFKIDGKYAQKGNGEIIESDATGAFTISVPVGTHEVKADKTNHVFVNDGKITDRYGNDLNYQKPLSERILYDSTTVRFIGRVAGGAIQEAYPLGHSLSTNNLGERLSITMELTSGDKYDINHGGADSIVTVAHLLPSGQTDSSKIHRSWIEFKKHAVIIHPDSVTGEFAVDLIPEVFNVVSVKATGYDDLIGTDPELVNLTDKFYKQRAVYAYKDSTAKSGGGWDYHDYSDTVFYNASRKFIERVNPVIEVKQITRSGKALAFFGDSSYTLTTFSGNAQEIPVYSAAGGYLFGFPVFRQNKKYQFRIKSYEVYPFYEAAHLTTPVKEDHVPTQGGLAMVDNKLRKGANATDTFSLDSKGSGVYEFTTGSPEVSDGIGLKGFAVNVKIGSQVRQWNQGNAQKGYIMGGEKTGNDFVTAGPNKITIVLRDPPGSNSYAYFEEGTVITSVHEYVGTAIQSGNEQIDAFLGNNVTTFAGVGAGTITSVDVENTQGLSISHEERYTGTNKTTEITTLMTRFATSDHPDYVGAEGDLFIGNSTNITYGSSLNLMIVKNDEVKAGSDLVFFDGPAHGKAYSIVKRTGINISPQYGTLFVYPQKHIEEVLIPNIIKIRNTLLLPSTTSAAVAQQRADNLKEEIYVSKLPAEDPNYGASNNDIDAFGTAAFTAPWDDGPSYKIYFPAAGLDYVNDTINTLNQYVRDWKAALADNEETKINPNRKVNNYSFTGGSNVAHSFQNQYSKTYDKNFNIILGGSFVKTFASSFNKTGVRVSINEGLATEQGGNFSDDSTGTKTWGFVLAEDGADYLSVDLYKAKDSSFVFRTQGGVTGCPYEGATTSKYYSPGTTIDQPTVKVEDPVITVDKPVVSDIPSNRKASYTLHLHNASEVERDVYFKLNVIDQSNPYGAKIFMDGAEMGSGREVLLKYGTPLTKTITLERGPDSMRYENIQLVLHSTCESDLADTVNLSAFFIPSCSDIHLKAPVDQWLLNTKSPVDNNGERYLPITLDRFNVNHSLFDHIALQYKPASDATWITVMNFYGDSATLKAADGPKQLITDNGEITYNLVMADGAFNDQPYDIRAVSYCMDNGQVISQTPSEIASGLKDTYTPRLFGSPQPANGILGVGDEIRLNFNEPVAAGLLTHFNFHVTGIRNGSKGDHAVSVVLDGKNDYLQTVFDKNLTGKSITVEMWVLPDGPRAQTLFSQGNKNNAMELALTADNHLQVTVGNTTVNSDKPLAYKPGEWAHVALQYDAQALTVSAFYNFTEVIHAVPVEKYSGTGPFVFGRSIGREGHFFAGKLHEARIWSTVRSATQLQVNSLTRLSGSENNLLAYYPMEEGKGRIARDKAHGNHAQLFGGWRTPPGKAMAFKGNGYLKVSTALSPVTPDMDYTMALWFKGAPGQTDVALASNGKGDGSDPGGSRNLFFLGFENGILTYENNGFKIQSEGDYLDGDWHQLTLAVNRVSGVAQLYVDGNLKKAVDAQNLGGVAAAAIYLGARQWYGPDDAVTPLFDRHFTGNIDEFRLWNTYLNSTLVASNNNVRLKGDELGLLAYYPFEKYYEFQNNKEMDSTLTDQKIQDDPNVKEPYAVAVNATVTNDMAPVKDPGPVENLQFDYVVNKDALIINIREPRQAIAKTIVTLQAENIRDENGNAIVSPITWTAYIDQNQLKWSDGGLNLSKDLYEPMQFEAYVINNGGSVQHFRLDNLPGWLTASATSGTVDPQGKQRITFTVNEGLNVGTYNEVIYMINDNDVSEALPFTLKVRGNTPDWQVNPADFAYSMTVYGKLQVNNLFSDNPEDMLAAFVDGKCVGVAYNSYIKESDFWYVFLTIYSDSLQMDNLRFRIWNADNGKIYTGIPSSPIAFQNDGVAGSPRTPVLFEGKELMIENLPLEKGWNWLSFNLYNEHLADVNVTLAKGSWSPGDIIKQDRDGFDQYSATAGWLGTLSGLNNLSLFKLKTAIPQTLSIEGIPLDIKNTPIPVKGGQWNYISYLPLDNMPVADALAGYQAANGDQIKSQTGFAMYDSRLGWVGNLSFLEPGKGYMLYRTAGPDTAFTYPSISGTLRLSADPLRAARLNPYVLPAAKNFYFADNMTVVAEVSPDFHLEPGDVVQAFAGTELRAKARALANPLTGRQALFFTIPGKEAQLLRFKVERNGETVAETDAVMSYRSGNRIGALAKPFMLYFGKTQLRASIAPNPFHDQLTVQLHLLPGRHKVQMLIYDMQGRLVFKQSPEKATGKRHLLHWDGRNSFGGDCDPGVYLLHIQVGGKQLIYKVIKY